MHQLGRKEFRHFARPYSPQVKGVALYQVPLIRTHEPSCANRWT